MGGFERRSLHPPNPQNADGHTVTRFVLEISEADGRVIVRVVTFIFVIPTQSVHYYIYIILILVCIVLSVLKTIFDIIKIQKVNNNNQLSIDKILK